MNMSLKITEKILIAHINEKNAAGSAEGAKVAVEALQAVRESQRYPEAIELLKKFAFYNADEHIEEHKERALEVQKFLRSTYAKDWVEEQKRLSFCAECDIYEDCRHLDGSCIEICECGEILIVDCEEDGEIHYHCERCPKTLTVTADGEKIWDCQLEPISEKDCPR